jgi:hypothetical protein
MKEEIGASVEVANFNRIHCHIKANFQDNECHFHRHEVKLMFDGEETVQNKLQQSTSYLVWTLSPSAAFA